MTTATSRYFALLALTAALWGAQPLLVKITMRELNPSTMTAVRYLLMSITFFALMRWRGLPLLPPLRLMPALLLMGITGVALNNIAQFTGLQLSTVSNATLIATTTPAVTALVALIFLRERLLPIELLGILLSVAGALFLVSKGQIDVLLHISFNKGDLLFFTAQLGWAVYSLTGFRVMRHLPPLTTTAWAGLFGTAGTFIYAALTGQLDVHSVGGTTLACMVYIVWIGGVCAMIFWNMGSRWWGRAGGHLPQHHAAGGRCPGRDPAGRGLCFPRGLRRRGHPGRGVHPDAQPPDHAANGPAPDPARPGAGGRPPAGCGKGIPPGLRPAGWHLSRDGLPL